MASGDSGQRAKPWSGQGQRPPSGWGTLVAIAALCWGVTALAGATVLAASVSYGSLAGTAVPISFGGGILAVVLGVIALGLVKARGQRGQRVAIAGLVTGALGLLGCVATIGYVVFVTLKSERVGSFEHISGPPAASEQPWDVVRPDLDAGQWK